MKKTDYKLKQYNLLNKGLKKSILNKIPVTSVGKSILAISLPALSFNTANAQCQGAAFTSMGFAGHGTANGIGVDVDGSAGDDILFYINGNDLKVKVLTGSLFVSNPGLASASAIYYNTGAAMVGASSKARPAVDYAFLAYGVNGASGAFSSGTTGNFSYKKGSFLGFVTLTTNYIAGGIPWEITVSERGTSTSAGAITAGVCASLPVELSSFKLKVKSEHISLIWKTASEENNAGFEVQRSTDGKNFQSLTFIEGNGTTVESQNYSFGDHNLRKGQLYYYRLKQIDYDGAFEYSKVLTGELKGSISGIFSPNPGDGSQTQLDYTAFQDGQLALRVYDAVGKELLTETHSVEEGTNYITPDFSDLETGIYFVKLEQGIHSSYQKLILNTDR